MLELALLGFLSEGPLHGYELGRRVVQLSGYARRVSDGSLYPAINRLVREGFVHRHQERGKVSAPRQVLRLTEAGRSELMRRLREPTRVEITDLSRFLTLLAFLSVLPDQADRNVVLRRRLTFLEQQASFFYDGDRPLRSNEVTDPYRRGMFVIAGAASRAERSWLHEQLAAGSAPSSRNQGA